MMSALVSVQGIEPSSKRSMSWQIQINTDNYLYCQAILTAIQMWSGNWNVPQIASGVKGITGQFRRYLRLGYGYRESSCQSSIPICSKHEKSKTYWNYIKKAVKRQTYHRFSWWLIYCRFENISWITSFLAELYLQSWILENWGHFTFYTKGFGI